MGLPILYTVLILVYHGCILGLMPIVFKRWCKWPDEWVRKFQHIGYAASIFLMVHLFDTWYLALMPSALLIIVGYPLFSVIEKRRAYNRYFVDRDKNGGEMRKSLLYGALSFVLLITLFWGMLGPQYRHVIPVAVIAWGIGDAAAALFGKQFGKTKIRIPGVDRAKTWFGSNANTIATGLVVLLMMPLYAKQPWLFSFIVAVVVAPIASGLELMSKDGLDTLTVPLGVALTMYLLSILFGYLGWLS
ncbi:MAG: hypothetical protein EA375_04730 [Acholeplasmataceae bacterium]|nr:MAG: hypothetical protein EA375_04730 [Acholeplasmataceae bacterium]